MINFDWYANTDTGIKSNLLQGHKGAQNGINYIFYTFIKIPYLFRNYSPMDIAKKSILIK